MSVKKYKISIHSSEVIRLIDMLPRGMRSPVIEAAVVMYMESDSGKNLLDILAPKNSVKPELMEAKPKDVLPKKQVGKKVKQQNNKSFLNKFRGGFVK